MESTVRAKDISKHYQNFGIIMMFRKYLLELNLKAGNSFFYWCTERDPNLLTDGLKMDPWDDQIKVFERDILLFKSKSVITHQDFTQEELLIGPLLVTDGFQNFHWLKTCMCEPLFAFAANCAYLSVMSPLAAQQRLFFLRSLATHNLRSAGSQF